MIANIVAVAMSGVAFLLTLVLILEFEYPNLERAGGADFHPVVVVMVFSAMLGAIFAAIWPSDSLRLAILSSSISWGFFFVVFVCYVFNGEIELVPLGQAVLALFSAILGALVSARISLRIRQRDQART